MTRPNTPKANARKYFSDWEGWSCDVEDADGEPCGEVIENVTKALQEHLKKVHGIDVDLEV